MKILLIHNGYSLGEKFVNFYNLIIESYKKLGDEVVLIGSDKLIGCSLIETKKEFFDRYGYYDYILFFDKDYELLRLIEELNIPVFNNSYALMMADDKRKSFRLFKSNYIAHPKTILIPFTFRKHSNYDFIDEIEKNLMYPYILKEGFGSFGEQVYLIENRKMLEEKLKLLAPSNCLVQELIKESFGRDVRVQVVGEQIVGAVIRTAQDGGLVANATHGGKMELTTLTEEEKQLILKTIKAFKLDFGGIDFIRSNRGPLLLEVNTNAHFYSFFHATKLNPVLFMKIYIEEKIKKRKVF